MSSPEYHREYYQKHKLRKLTDANLRYQKQKEDILEYKKKFYYDNKPRIQAQKKEYYKDNAILWRVAGWKAKGINITLEQYKRLLGVQGYCCAICNRNQSEFKRALSVDHDHITGKIRGLLCGNCNSALGKFRDSKQVLQKAIGYLDNAYGK